MLKYIHSNLLYKTTHCGFNPQLVFHYMLFCIYSVVRGCVSTDMLFCSTDMLLLYCGICRRRQLPISIQDELERPRVRSTWTQALGTSREVWVFNWQDEHWYIKWLKSGFRSQKWSLLNIKMLQYEMTIINTSNMIRI